jgi:hypothetical protein
MTQLVLLELFSNISVSLHLNALIRTCHFILALLRTYYLYDLYQKKVKNNSLNKLNVNENFLI